MLLPSFLLLLVVWPAYDYTTAQDIIDGNSILILGLVWQIIRIQLLSSIRYSEDCVPKEIRWSFQSTLFLRSMQASPFGRFVRNGDGKRCKSFPVLPRNKEAMFGLDSSQMRRLTLQKPKHCFHRKTEMTDTRVPC